jgi:hypothetical protein
MKKELTRAELYPINAETNDRDHMEYELKRIFNRHIAKCLDHLGDTIAPVQMASIKRSFRFLEEDITTLVTNGDTHEQNNDQDGIGNR